MQLSGQRPPVLPIFIGVILQMPGQDPKLGHDCFLLHLSSQHYIVWATDINVKQLINTLLSN